MFGSLKSLKACTAHISHWLICHEIRNEEGVNVPCLIDLLHLRLGE